MLGESLLFWFWITNIDGIGTKKIRALLNYYNDPEKIYRTSKDELESVTNLSETKLNIILNSKGLKKAKSILESCNMLNIKLLTMNNPDYPKNVRTLENTPILLYYRGNIIKDSIGGSIVGSQRCTDYGKRIVKEAVEFLVGNKVPLISSMAKGINGYAQTACLNVGGYTNAFLG